MVTHTIFKKLVRFFLVFAFLISTAYVSIPQSPLKIVDAAGRTVELAKIPQRIVVVGRATYMPLHLLYMFPEGLQRVVAMEKRGQGITNFAEVIHPKFKEVVLLESPNAETIAAQKPDLVIMKSLSNEALGEPLSKINIPVVYLGMETPELLYKDLTNLGILLGNEKRAAEIAAYYQGRLEQIQKKAALLTKKPSTLVLYYTEKNNQAAVQVPPKSFTQTFQVEQTGGNPVWLEAAGTSANWITVNLEQVIKWDAEKLVLSIPTDLDAQKILDQLKANPQWAGMKAFKNNQVYVYPVDFFAWDTADPRWILGLSWMATCLQPDTFKDVDLTQEVYQFYALYGMDKSLVDSKILSKLKLNLR